MPKIKFTGVPNAEKRKNINLEAQLENTQEKLNKLTEFLGLKVEQIDDHQFEVIKEEIIVVIPGHKQLLPRSCNFISSTQII